MKQEKKLYWHFTASCCLVVFTLLGYLVKFYPATLEYVDSPISQFIRSYQTPRKTAFFIWITKFGSAVTITLFLLVFLYLNWRKKRKIEMIWLFVNSAFIAGISNFLIKFLFDRPRPAVPHLVVETHSSFPSGHAMGSMLFYGSFIILLPTYVSSRKICRFFQVFLSVLILAVGMSRVYLGVHFPTDILGGYCLGAAWLLATYPIAAEKRFIQDFQQK